MRPVIVPFCGPSLFCDGGWITGTRGVSVVRCPEEASPTRARC
jgi:hypothetical protein